MQDSKPIAAIEREFNVGNFGSYKSEDGLLLAVFLDGKEIECKMKKNRKGCQLGNTILVVFYFER